MVGGISTKKILASCMVLALLALAGCGSIMPEEQEQLAPPLIEVNEVTYNTYTASYGYINTLLEGRAVLVSYDEHEYYFTESGNIIKNKNVKAGDSVSAGDVLLSVETGDLEYNIQQQQLSLEQLQISLVSLQEQLSYYNSMSPDEKPSDLTISNLKVSIETKKLDIEKANLTMARLNDQLKASTLVAETDGVVSYVTISGPGESVSAYTTLVTVSDPSKLQLHYESSTKANSAKTGMAATITYMGQEYPGSVVQTPADVPVDDEINKSVILISCSELPANLTVGDFVDFYIILAEKDNALIVPKIAVTTYSSTKSSYCTVWDGDNKTEYEVTLGIQGSEYVEILSGIKEGDNVIVD